VWNGHQHPLFSETQVASCRLHFQLRVQDQQDILRVLLDYRPLRVFGMLGSIFFVIGLAFEIFLFVFYLINGSFTPYKSPAYRFRIHHFWHADFPGRVDRRNDQSPAPKPGPDNDRTEKTSFK
jgi:hypothetical protein